MSKAAPVPEGDAAPPRSWSADERGILGTAVVFFGVAWLPWYEASVVGTRVRLRAWDLGVLAVVAVLLALYAAGRVLWLRRHPLPPEVPLAPTVEPFVASFAATVLTIYRLLDVPYAAQRTVWLWVALGAVVLQTLFAARAMARTGFRA